MELARRGWRWDRTQRTISAEAARVVVCSELDRQRLHAPNAAVVPNGYPTAFVVPALSPECEPRANGSSLLFVGPLTYEPNRLGVEWVIEEILPRVRAEIPDCLFEVVGDVRGVQLAGRDTDGVLFHGHVARGGAVLGPRRL